MSTSCSSAMAPTMPGTKPACWCWAPCTCRGKSPIATWTASWRMTSGYACSTCSSAASRTACQPPTCSAKPGSVACRSSSTSAYWCPVRRSVSSSKSASNPGWRRSRRASSTSAPAPAASVSWLPKCSPRPKWCWPTCRSTRWRWPTRTSSAMASTSACSPCRVTALPACRGSAST